MATPSVSFRISRSAEDLAGTLHLLSQRLVQLEQRLSVLEAREHREPEEDPALETSLDNAERLLLDCRSLLEGALQECSQPGPEGVADQDPEDCDPQQAIAASDAQDAVASSDPCDQIEEAGFDLESDPEAEFEAADLDAIPLFQVDASDSAAA